MLFNLIMENIKPADNIKLYLCEAYIQQNIDALDGLTNNYTTSLQVSLELLDMTKFRLTNLLNIIKELRAVIRE